MAADLFAPNRRTSAIAFMFTGLTLATLIGAPAGTWLAQTVSWRATFFAITVIGIIAIAGVLLLVPRGERHEPPRLRRELAAFTDIRVYLPWDHDPRSRGIFHLHHLFSPYDDRGRRLYRGRNHMAFVAVRTRAVRRRYSRGRFADRALMLLLYVTLATQAIVLLTFSYIADSQIASAICIFLMATFGFATVAPIQKLVTDNARAAGAPNLASAVNIGLLNLGNAIGAWAGGAVIAGGFGYATPDWAGAFLSAAALVLALVSGVIGRNDKQLPVPASAAATYSEIRRQC
ncbi:MFS transporter [Rhizobium sp. PP-CC-3G-465]|nr:MFS transporter [Rhizobium sp. PP-CC-3G-465]